MDLRGDAMKFMMVPPQTSGHSLTHEQVMPFLKKLESGQQREGELDEINAFLRYIYILYLFRHFEGDARFGGDIKPLCGYIETLCGKYNVQM